MSLANTVYDASDCKLFILGFEQSVNLIRQYIYIICCKMVAKIYFYLLNPFRNEFDIFQLAFIPSKCKDVEVSCRKMFEILQANTISCSSDNNNLLCLVLGYGMILKQIGTNAVK